MENLNTIFQNIEDPSSDKKLGNAISTILKDDLKKDFKSTLRTTYGVERKEKQEKSRFRIFRYIGAIAASLLLVGAALFLMKPVDSYDSLMTAYAKEVPMKHPGILKGSDDKSREVAILAYQNQKWDLSIRSFSNIANPTSTDLFYRALSTFYKGEYSKALSELNSLPASNYSQEVTWYKALAYLKLDKLAEAKTLLSTIQKGDWKYDDAVKLLRTEVLKSK